MNGTNHAKQNTHNKERTQSVLMTPVSHKRTGFLSMKNCISHFLSHGRMGVKDQVGEITVYL
jgi:hypothetical protein